MSTSEQERLLARLAGNSSDSVESIASLEATKPNEESGANQGAQLDELLQRINSLAAHVGNGPPPSEPLVAPTPQAQSTSPPQAPAPPTVAGAQLAKDDGPAEPFVPPEPQSLQQAGLNESEVEELILKYLLARGEDTFHGVADRLCVSFAMVEPILRQMKQDQLLVYKGMTSVNDYVSQLTDMGRDRARRHNMNCTYYGAAPVSLADYVASVSAQSLVFQHPSEKDLKRAFEDLLINPKMFLRLGPAINSGRGLFLFGFPGNGKTSIAERVTKCFGQSVWIPRTLGVEGEIILLFDPSHHEEVPLNETDGILQKAKYDRRWVRIRRPTIIVGGELTMDNLELSYNRTTGINEAPIQLKSNCGTLVIDDFGRQRMTTDELLNRWIVPLEKRYDFLNLASGKKIQVPFDQLIVFSTNLEPRDLVDEAFLRRIPYKIEVIDPTESEFRELFQILCPAMNIPFNTESLDYLIETHYKKANRPFRCCHPRDILLQVRNYCQYREQEHVLSFDNLDFAVSTYFAAV